jgi:hypothetical protein
VVINVMTPVTRETHSFDVGVHRTTRRVCLQSTLCVCFRDPIGPCERNGSGGMVIDDLICLVEGYMVQCMLVLPLWSVIVLALPLPQPSSSSLYPFAIQQSYVSYFPQPSTCPGTRDIPFNSQIGLR